MASGTTTGLLRSRVTAQLAGVSALRVLAFVLLVVLAGASGLADAGAGHHDSVKRVATVNDTTNTTASFGRTTTTDHRGDVVSIPVRLSHGEQTTLTIENRAGTYQTTLQLVDGSGDGRVVVDFNTYTAGHGETWADETVSPANWSDTVRVLTRTGSAIDRRTAPDGVALDATTYALTLRADGNATATGSVELVPPQARNVTVWTAPAGTSTDAITTPVESSDAPVTPTHSTAMGDLLVVEIRADGIEGAIEHAGSETAADGSWFELAFRQNESTVRPSAPATRFELGPANATVVGDRDGTYVFVVDTGEGKDGELPRLHAGDAFTATLSVGEDTKRSDPTATHVRFTEAALDTHGPNEQGLFVVRPPTGRTVGGTTTLAPGTELAVAVRAQNGTTWNWTTTVGPDRRFALDPARFERFPSRTQVAVNIRADDRVERAALPTIVVDDRPTDLTIDRDASNRTAIVFESVTLSRGGFVAIHRNDTHPPTIGNSSFLPPGTTANVTVPVEDSVANETTLVALPYHDHASDRRFTIGDTTRHYWRQGSQISRKFTTGQTPAGTENDSTAVPSTGTVTPTPETTKGTVATSPTVTSIPETGAPTQRVSTEGDAGTPSTAPSPATDSTNKTSVTDGAGPGFGAVAVILAGACLVLAAMDRRC